MPRTRKVIGDHSLLTAALEGLELQKQRIDEQIRKVRSLLGKSVGRRKAGPTPGKHGVTRLSAAARRRIAAAQKRRWAEYRKTSGKSE